MQVYVITDEKKMEHFKIYVYITRRLYNIQVYLDRLLRQLR